LSLVGGPIDYLKMDIKGREHGVLRTTRPETLRSISYIDLDIHNPQNLHYYEKNTMTSHELLEHLRKCGFEMAEVDEGNVSCRRTSSH